VGVFAAYTSAFGYSLVDKRLYIPEYWFSDDYTEKRIVLSHGGLPQKTVWVIIRRRLGEEPGYSFYIA